LSSISGLRIVLSPAYFSAQIRTRFRYRRKLLTLIYKRIKLWYSRQWKVQATQGQGFVVMKNAMWRIVGLLLILLTVSTVRAQTPTPNPDTVVADCAAMLPPDRPMPTGADAPSIKIVYPATGTVIRSDADKFAEITFTVEVENFDMDAGVSSDESNHWHLWLNNSIWGMYTSTEGFTALPYGNWRMCVSMGDAAHADLGTPDAIYVRVEEGADGEGTVIIEPTTAADSSAVESLVSPDPSTEPDSPTAIIGVVILGVAALGAGLWLGGRRANRP
jgi:hypothetical protein